MKRTLITALLVSAALSSSAFASGHRGHGYERDDDGHGHGRHYRHHRARHVVVHHKYDEAEPRTIIQERVVYRDRPVAYDDTPPPQEPVPAAMNGRQLIGQAIGAVAGAALGNQVGGGNGRVVATAVGAVLGGALGGAAIN